MLTGGKGIVRLWDGRVYTAMFKMDNQQRDIVQHMELYSNDLPESG